MYLCKLYRRNMFEGCLLIGFGYSRLFIIFCFTFADIKVGPPRPRQARAGGTTFYKPRSSE